MPIGTAVHERTFALCESLNYREWSGYYAVSAYEGHHEHEYNAIRNAAALIDVSPLFKYLVTGRDAARFIDRLITRDVSKMEVGQVFYTPWCDERGQVIDDGTVSRLSEQMFRWTAADPSLRWFRQNAAGFDVAIEDMSEAYAALALQGPTSARLLRAVSSLDVDRLKYFRVDAAAPSPACRWTSRAPATPAISATRSGSRRGTRVTVWDALMAARQAVRHQAVRHARARRRARRGRTAPDRRRLLQQQEGADRVSRRYSPYEIGLGRLVSLDKTAFIGQQALREEHARGPARQVVGLELEWTEVERIYENARAAARASARRRRASRCRSISGGRQVGRATTTTWSPVLKRMIALATVERPHYAEGTQAQIEVTVEAVRHRVGATVVKTPFFNPPRKTALRRPELSGLPRSPSLLEPEKPPRTAPRLRVCLRMERRRSSDRRRRAGLRDSNTARARRRATRSPPATARRRASPAGSSDPRSRSRPAASKPGRASSAGGSATRRC